MYYRRIKLVNNETSDNEAAGNKAEDGEAAYKKEQIWQKVQRI
jgi:hypothetical protein